MESFFPNDNKENGLDGNKKFSFVLCVLITDLEMGLVVYEEGS